MANFYFTYGSDKQFPYQNGYSKIIAEDIQEACRLFNAVHPKRKGSGCMNCAFYYNEVQWNSWDSKLKIYYPCFEVIRVVYLTPASNNNPEPYIAVTPIASNEVIVEFYGN